MLLSARLFPGQIVSYNTSNGRAYLLHSFCTNVYFLDLPLALNPAMNLLIHLSIQKYRDLLARQEYDTAPSASDNRQERYGLLQARQTFAALELGQPIPAKSHLALQDPWNQNIQKNLQVSRMLASAE